MDSRFRGNDKNISVLTGVNLCLYERQFEKQSQFLAGCIGVKFYLERIYDNKPRRGAQKNKANSNHVLSEAEWTNRRKS
jgi:hypothetical protein